MNSLNIKILETLKCPCCSYFMNGPIYVCLSGHSICDTCWKDKKCRLCQLTLTVTRNFSLETISTLVDYPCKFQENGCDQFFPFEELDEHQKNCNYRNYICQLDEFCFWEGHKDKLRQHCFIKHDSNILIGEECICFWKNDKPEHTTYLMIAFDEMFYIHAKIRDDIFFWAVQYIGRSEDIILFCFEVQIFTNQFKDRKLQLCEICHDDIQEDIDEIIDSGFCVAVPLTVLETYMNLEGAVFYKIQIKKA